MFYENNTAFHMVDSGLIYSGHSYKSVKRDFAAVSRNSLNYPLSLNNDVEVQKPLKSFLFTLISSEETGCKVLKRNLFISYGIRYVSWNGKKTNNVPFDVVP